MQNLTSHESCLAWYIKNIIMPENTSGFTLNAMSFKQPEFTQESFFVSKKGYEQRFENTPQFTDIFAWIKQHCRLLYMPGHHIGGWRDGQLYYLDITMVIKGRAKAQRVAMTNGQMAIYHPCSEKTIYVNQ